MSNDGESHGTTVTHGGAKRPFRSTTGAPDAHRALRHSVGGCRSRTIPDLSRGSAFAGRRQRHAGRPIRFLIRHCGSITRPRQDDRYPSARLCWWFDPSTRGGRNLLISEPVEDGYKLDRFQCPLLAISGPSVGL